MAIEHQLLHVLEGGAPLCNFMPGRVPADWPARHKWLSRSDLCPHCISRMTKNENAPFELIIKEERLAFADGHQIIGYVAKLDSESKAWVEAFTTDLELTAFLKGVNAAMAMMGVYMPRVERP